jgi:hypothetical protein
VTTNYNFWCKFGSCSGGLEAWPIIECLDLAKPTSTLPMVKAGFVVVADATTDNLGCVGVVDERGALVMQPAPDRNPPIG